MEFLKWLFGVTLLPDPEEKELSKNELEEIKGADDVNNFYIGKSKEELMSPKRLDGEDFEMYKLRQREIKIATENMKSGRVIWHSRDSKTFKNQ